ncbi:MAG: radical SAM protein [Eubacterium sp.]|nr:radical SAM protein [Eubacterium sp.]
MKTVRKVRPESFGGLVFSEKPGYVAYLNKTTARLLGIKNDDNIILPEGIFSYPMDAHFALTTRCNLYCRGCYTTTAADEKSDMDFEKAKRIIDNLSKMKVFSVSFGGGEPTLYTKLFELAEYARSKNVLPNITTNGVNMTAEFANQMKVFGNVHLSLHTMKDKNHLEKAVCLLKKAGIKQIGLNLLLSTDTIPHIESIFKWAKEQRFKRVLCLRYKHTDKNKEIKDLSIDENFYYVFNDIFRFGKKYKIKVMTDCSAVQEFIGYGKASEKLLYYFDTNGCQGGNAYIAITVDGMVKPCSFWGEAFFDAETMTQYDWLNNEKIVAFRNATHSERCKSCEHIKICHGGCRLPDLNCCKD